MPTRLIADRRLLLGTVLSILTLAAVVAIAIFSGASASGTPTISALDAVARPAISEGASQHLRMLATMPDLPDLDVSGTRTSYEDASNIVYLTPAGEQVCMVHEYLPTGVVAATCGRVNDLTIRPLVLSGSDVRGAEGALSVGLVPDGTDAVAINGEAPLSVQNNIFLAPGVARFDRLEVRDATDALIDYRSYQHQVHR